MEISIKKCRQVCQGSCCPSTRQIHSSSQETIDLISTFYTGFRDLSGTGIGKV